MTEQGKSSNQNNPQSDRQIAGPEPPPSPPSKRWRFWGFFSKSEWVMVFLTAVIAATGVVGIHLVIQGGSDTQKMIKAVQQQARAAQKSAKAAQDFARTADLINGNINDAVTKLNAQAKATQRSANAAKSAADTAVASLRPWIKITNVQTGGEGPIIPALSFQISPLWPAGTSQSTFQLQISLKNIGHSPARLTVDFELFLPLWKNGYSDVIYKEKRRFCNAVARKGLKVDPSLQIILFPEEPHDWHGGGVALVDSKAINYYSGHGTAPYILPVVAVCTNYQFGDSPTIYQTSALYEVFRKDDRTRFFEVGKGVPASEIFLIRNEASDDAH